MSPIRQSEYDSPLSQRPGNEINPENESWFNTLNDIKNLEETGDSEGRGSEMSGDELEDQERNTDKDDGQTGSATANETGNDALEADEEEDEGLYSPGDGGRQGVRGRLLATGARIKGKTTKKRAAIAGAVTTLIVGSIFMVITLIPSLIINNLRSFLLDRAGELRTSHQLKYRRSKLARFQDAFSKEGRMGSKIILEMEKRNYHFEFGDPSDSNRITSIRAPDGRMLSAASGAAAQEISDFMEWRHPLRFSGWKTKRMTAFKNRFKLPTTSIVSAEPEADTRRQVNKAIAESTIADTDIDTSYESIEEAGEDATEDEIRRQTDDTAIKDTIEESGTVFDEAKAELVNNGTPLSEIEGGGVIQEAISGSGSEFYERAAAEARGTLGSRALGAATSALNPLAISSLVCTIKGRIANLVGAVRLGRATAFMRNTGLLSGVADATRTGNVSPKLMNEIGKRLTGLDSNKNPFGASQGFAFLAKGVFSKSANDSSRPGHSVDGRLSGPIAALDRGTDSFPGTSRSTCSVVQNPITQVGATVVVTFGKAILCVFTAGAGCASAQAAQQAAQGAALAAIKASVVASIKGIVTKAAIRDAILSTMAGMSFEALMNVAQMHVESTLKIPMTGQERGQMMADGAFSGAGTLNKQRGLEAGFVPATEDEYVAAQNQFLAEKRSTFKNLSVAERYLSMEQDSLTYNLATTAIMSTPSGTEGLANIPQYAFKALGDTLTLGGFSRVAGSINGDSRVMAATSDPDMITHETYTINNRDSATSLEGTKLATDPSGNLIPIMRSDIESVDPEINKESLVNSGDIDPDTFEPKSDDFKEHIENCVNTPDTLSQLEFNNDINDPGKDCLAKNQKTVKYKAHLMFLDMKDQIEAEFDPDSIHPGSNGGSSTSNGPVNCSSAVGNEKIICAAEGYQGIPYSNDGTPALNGGNNAEAWLERNSSPSSRVAAGIDCSGFTNLALYTAFKYKTTAGCSGAYVTGGDKNIVEIPLDQVRPGDFLTVSRVCNSDTISGHVGIFVRREADGTVVTLESAGGNNAAGKRESGYYNHDPEDMGGYWKYAARYIGPGSSP